MTNSDDKSGDRLTQNNSRPTASIDLIYNDTLKRYVEARRKIDEEINCLMAFTSLLSQYKDCVGDEFLVEPYAIGYVNQMLHGRVLEIIEELDAFLPLGETMGAIMEEVEEA